MPAQRSTRKLKIRTHDPGVLHRVTSTLEDALGTASLPGIPPNGMAFIKKLHLNLSMPSVTSGTLAHKIDNLVRNLTLARPDVTSGEQSDATAVWFSDELEPYRFLIAMLAQGVRPQAWYWTAAVKVWTPDLTPEQGIHRIISQVSQMPSGVTGLADVVAPLLDNDVLLEVLTRTEPAQVTQWLANVGINATPVSKSLREAFGHRAHPKTSGTALGCWPSLPSTWQNAIQKVLGMWSANDPRSILTACIGLAQTRLHVDSNQTMSLLHEAVHYREVRSFSSRGKNAEPEDSAENESDLSFAKVNAQYSAGTHNTDPNAQSTADGKKGSLVEEAVHEDQKDESSWSSTGGRQGEDSFILGCAGVFCPGHSSESPAVIQGYLF